MAGSLSLLVVTQERDPPLLDWIPFLSPPLLFYEFFFQNLEHKIDDTLFSFTGLIISGIEFIFILKKGKYIFIVRTEFS